LELSKDDPPFYALIMAAMRKADTDNTQKFMYMWPEVWGELSRRYHAPGGILPEDGPVCTCCGNPECEDCPSECPVHRLLPPGSGPCAICQTETTYMGTFNDNPPVWLCPVHGGKS